MSRIWSGGIAVAAATFVLGVVASAGAAPVSLATPEGKPEAIVDLRTAEGVALVLSAWRYSDARIVEVDFKAAGADLKPSGPRVRTQDIEPKAGAADFDDSSWEVLDPASLEARRSTGRLAFNWYRTKVTVPAKVGAFDPTGSTLVFEIVVDDYAEVWVDGRLHYPLGQSGGAAIKGYNAPNRVVLGRDVQPGQQFQIAVFGINGPLSNPPANYIWVRSAALDFYAAKPLPALGETLRLDPALDRILPADARIEKVAEGLTFGEGPVWDSEGSLLFSDPNQNVIYRWSADDGISVFRANSGYAGTDIGRYGQPGSNGLTFDPEGRLTIDQHGNRRVVRLEKNGGLTVLADRYQGQRLNSPNDLVYRSDGRLYFTDPPFGLPKFFDDPAKELSYSGVFSWRDGELRLEFDRPHRPERHRLLAGRTVPLRHQLGHGEEGRDALPGRGRRPPRPGRGVLRHDRGAGRAGARWPQGRPGGQPLRLRPGRRLGDLAGGQASRHDQGARAAGQLRLGRCRRPHALHDRAHRPLPDPDPDPRHPPRAPAVLIFSHSARHGRPPSWGAGRPACQHGPP